MQLYFIHHAACWLLAIFLLFAGIGHLTWARTEFQAQVPGWLPLESDLVVVVSGFVEIGLGLALLLFKTYRQQVGWAVALFFLLIFPGNIAKYINKVDAFGLNSDTTRLIRLFFQPVLIVWALWCTGALAGRKKQLAD